MRKIQIEKNIRLASILCSVALIGILATFCFIRYKNPIVEEKKFPVYSYESKDKVNYQVFLKPNSLYYEKSIGEDQVYIANLVDYIDATYTYEFTGEREAEIKGSYEVIAVVEGYTADGDKHTTLWQKQFPLVAKTNFEANDKKYTLNKKLPLKISDFNALVEKIREETKLSTQVKVTTIMNVELNANTDKGVIEKKSTTSLEVPLASDYFKITKTQGEGKPEALIETKSVPRPLNKNLLMGSGLGMGILFLVILVLIFGTEQATPDPLLEELKKIFKKHGTRLVALDSEIAATCEKMNSVHSFEDLVRISDEIGKPIIYKHSANYKENSKFWVIDENRYYVYELNEAKDSNSSWKEKVKASNERINNTVSTVNIDIELATASQQETMTSKESQVTWSNI